MEKIETLKNRTCIHCNGKLKKAGRDRKNGRTHFKDWKERNLHIDCYDDYLIFLRWKEKNKRT